MQHQSWQRQLHASVQLYLALGVATPSLAQECDQLLQRTERELLDFLLAGAPPTASERQRAQRLLDQAQLTLLREVQPLSRWWDEDGGVAPLLQELALAYEA